MRSDTHTLDRHPAHHGVLGAVIAGVLVVAMCELFERTLRGDDIEVAAPSSALSAAATEPASSTVASRAAVESRGLDAATDERAIASSKCVSIAGSVAEDLRRLAVHDAGAFEYRAEQLLGDASAPLSERFAALRIEVELEQPKALEHALLAVRRLPATNTQESESLALGAMRLLVDRASTQYDVRTMLKQIAFAETGVERGLRCSAAKAFARFAGSEELTELERELARTSDDDLAQSVVDGLRAGSNGEAFVIAERCALARGFAAASSCEAEP